MVKKTFENTLLVEGINDQHVIWALCGRLEIKENFEVNACNSVEQVLDAFEVKLKSTNTSKRLGIVIDADVDLTLRWESIRNILVKTGIYDVPSELPKEGLIVFPSNEDSLVVGVWVMPDNSLNGMLEDFLAQMAPQSDKLLDKTDQILDELELEKIQKYRSVHKAKARIHTWLAWQEDPGTPMGQAITKHYLSTENKLCCSFVNWLRELFSCP